MPSQDRLSSTREASHFPCDSLQLENPQQIVGKPSCLAPPLLTYQELRQVEAYSCSFVSLADSLKGNPGGVELSLGDPIFS